MINQILSKTDIDQLQELISSNNLFILTCHAGPDGDAIGSTLAMAHYLRALGKETQVIVPDAYPDFLAWMSGSQDIVRFDKHREKAELLLRAADVIFALDYNGLKRVDDMGPIIEKAKAHKVLIDHHLAPEKFCELQFSYPELSSTCEVVFRVIYQLNGYNLLTKQACECLYVLR